MARHLTNEHTATSPTSRSSLHMKTPLLTLAALGCLLSPILAQDSKAERFTAKDTNQDGKLSREELGDAFWNRAAGFDANADGILNATELAALNAKKGRTKTDPQARPGGANTSFTVKEFTGSNGQTIRYSLFLPDESVPRPLPLVLCLHGAGGNTAAANRLAAPAMQKTHPCIVAAPACNGKATRWVSYQFRGENARPVLPELMEALDAIATEFKADPARWYITGQSMGGVGTWGVIASHPDKFAAAVPVCGIWDPADATKMKGVPVWAFHGAKDPTVPVEGSRNMVSALKALGAMPEPKYTEFPETGHGSWEPAYETAELWEWMFAQRRKLE